MPAAPHPTLTSTSEGNVHPPYPYEPCSCALLQCGAIGFTPLDFIMPLILYSFVHKRVMGWARHALHNSLVSIYTGASSRRAGGPARADGMVRQTKITQACGCPIMASS